MLQVHFEAQDKKFTEYLAVCEKLGKEPDLSKIPIDTHNFPYEVQLAFVVHDTLPDRWEGMSGSYLGKEWSAVGTLLDIYEITERKTVLFFLKTIDILNSKAINKQIEINRKKQERKSQGKDMSSMNLPKGK